MLVALMMLLFTVGMATADSLDHWTRRHPNPDVVLIEGQFHDVAFDGVFFVAAGPDGAVVKSSNGFTWVRRTLPQGVQSARRIYAYDGAFYILAGDKILRSPTGDEWSVVHSGTPVVSMANGNGQLLATTGTSAYLSSTTGIDWVEKTFGIDGGIEAIAFGEGRFVAGGTAPGDGRTMRPLIALSSEDGDTWTNHSLLPPEWLGGFDAIAMTEVIHTGGRFIGVGHRTAHIAGQHKAWFRSEDGHDWEIFQEPAQGPYPPGEPSMSFTSVQEVFGEVLAGAWEPGFYRLSSGDQWTLAGSGLNLGRVRLAEGHGLVLAAGAPAGAGEVSLSVSRAFGQWQRPHKIQVPTPTLSLPLPSSATGNGVALIRITSSQVYRSTDGVDWRGVDTFPEGACGALRYLNGRFIQLLCRGLDEFAATSMDGMEWEIKPLPFRPSFSSDMAFRDGLYAVPLEREVWTSADLTLWTSHSVSFPGNVARVIAGPDRFVGVGAGFAVVSTNGKEWGVVQIGGGPALRDVLHDGAQYVAAGEDGIILTSSDGIQWTPRTVPSTQDFVSITQMSGRVMAVGSQGDVVSSTDGVNWQSHSFSTAKELVTAAGFSNSVIAADSGGALFQSGSLTPEAPRLVGEGVTGLGTPAGSTVVLSVEAVGSDSLAYEWRHDGVIIDGANGPTLEIIPVEPSDAGEYQVTVSNIHGSASASRQLEIGSFVVPFASIRVSANDGQATLEVWALPGQRYRVETAHSLNAPEWTPIAEEVISEERWIVPVEAPVTGSAFFRVRAIE